MVDRYVVSKSQSIRIPCDGPHTAHVVSCKLEEEMIAAGQNPDVDVEFVKRPRTRARVDAGAKRSTKLRYK
jgi:uncharacterized ParB-like nuclease family protein